MNNNNLEKKTISFEKSLHKKDIKKFLSSLSNEFSYDMINVGNISNGVDNNKQNECSGTIALNEINLSYVVQIHGDNVHHMQLSYLPTIDKEILNAVERKIADFFSTYP